MLKYFLSTMLVASLIGVALLTPRPAHAAGVVGIGTPASCTEAALVAALASGGAVTFNCGSNPHTITFTNRKTINGDTSIDGADKISFNGGGTTGFFSLSSARRLTLTAMTLTNAGNMSSPSTGLGIAVGDGILSIANSTFSQNTRGAIAGLTVGGVVTIMNSVFISNSASLGGAIYNTGQLFVSDSVFRRNDASISSEGGAIYNTGSGAAQGKITLIRSSFISNTGGYGGAIANYGVLTMSQSTLTNNGSSFNGGGGGGAILNGSGAQLMLTNVTLSGNSTQPASRGAALYVSGTALTGGRAKLVNVTIADNASPNGQLHLSNFGVVELENTIITNGQCTKDAAATLTDSGGNLAFNATGCPGTNTDPLLGPLQDNGGPTLTRALPGNSPARDQGINIGCPVYDQRGVIRPQHGNCDMGAVEYNATPLFDSISPIQACVGANNLMLTVTGTNLIDGPFGTHLKLNSVLLSTTFVSPTQLTTIIGAAELAAPPHTLTFTLETPVVDGAVSAATREVVVDVCNQPISGLTATSDSPTLLGNTTQFTATLATGGGVSYQWGFGDGQIGSGTNPTHTYTGVGSYIAVVTATNNLGYALADTVVNVNLATTAKLFGQLTSEFGPLITYTYRITNITPAGPGTDVTVIISGNVPANTALVSATNVISVPTGGDYGNGFVVTQPPVVLQSGQSFTLVWTVRPLLLIGDVVNQAHASTDDGRLQMFERDRVFRVFMMSMLG